MGTIEVVLSAVEESDTPPVGELSVWRTRVGVEMLMDQVPGIAPVAELV